MDKIAAFVAKKKSKLLEEETKPLPWYKKPIDAKAFILKKGRNTSWYAHHKDWVNHIWIGPYEKLTELEEIIKNYNQSLENGLIHSVFIENEKDFFLKET